MPGSNVKTRGRIAPPSPYQNDAVDTRYKDKWQWLADKTDQMRLTDFIENYQKPSRVIWINMLAGVSRGVGLTIGTALIIALIGFILSFFVSMPLVGKYIAQLLDWVNTFKTTK
ncbi:DUF5665 domain-containing protein [Aneurinibacillus tyrosinisolvens]|uniref:DUF5665 domain-containing protein n=1 Tax=Aneurinibacillus tyrosinisolvens TaxID=1443435 RepID=UPI00069B32F7|nr:DUF5665 domain-containing protein [Aneurinibacillus tyrosinisolvens]